MGDRPYLNGEMSKYVLADGKEIISGRKNLVFALIENLSRKKSLISFVSLTFKPKTSYLHFTRKHTFVQPMDVDFDFWQFLVWNIEFDELDFFSSLYWTFTGYTGIKNPVQTRKKPSVYQTRSFQLENVKTQVHIDREIGAAGTTEVAPKFSDPFALFQTHHHRGWTQNVLFRNSVW